MILIIDNETIPDETVEKPIFDESTIKLGNTKDPEKIKAKIEQAKIQFESGLTKKMSIESDYARILSIGYIEYDEIQKKIIWQDVIFNENNDADILKEFNKVYTGQKIIGWNSKKFDIPLIWKRGIITGQKVFTSNYKDICNPFRNESIDLMLDWNDGGMGKLTACCKRLGIEVKTGMDGSMIYDVFKEKRYDEIKAYNLQDCQATLAIYKKLYEV